MKFILKFFIFSILILACNKQNTSKKINQKKPKLIIGIVIDQMRYDYLYRFKNRFNEGGFKRLLKNGFSLENARYNYIPTYTAVGHTSIYTGTTPFNHGIISNYWYDKFLKKIIYCVNDSNYKTVGNNGKGGEKSPFRMLTTTITDQLHLAQNMNGKTIGIALKDRSSILPAGHTANAAYWFDGGSKGSFITSSYYMNTLPKWVNDFNKSGKVDEYLKKPWKTLYDISTYTQSREDDNNFEVLFIGEEKPVFPHDIPSLRSKNNNYSILKSIPAGNSITTDFAKACILGENLGKSKYTDFLTISYSSTDYIGHQYGVDSKEIEDTYLRLDKELETLLNFLDNKIGKNNYTLFLTADHGAVPVPSYLKSLKIPANYLNILKLKDFVNNVTKKYFNSDELVENISNFQIFLNYDKIEKLGLKINNVTDKIIEKIIAYPSIQKAVSAKTLQTTTFSKGILNALQNGYNQKISGDIMLIPSPATLPTTNKKGTSHGSGYSYDTHIPLIFYGKGIKQGHSKERYNIIDLSPTICNLLKIEFPNGNTGKVIVEALK